MHQADIHVLQVEALRNEWDEPIKTSIKEHILESEEVIDFKEWAKGNNNRTYLTLKGMQRSYRGDMNCQVYFDNHLQKLVVIRGKGMTSRTMDASIAAVQAIN